MPRRQRRRPSLRLRPSSCRHCRRCHRQRQWQRCRRRSTPAQRWPRSPCREAGSREVPGRLPQLLVAPVGWLTSSGNAPMQAEAQTQAQRIPAAPERIVKLRLLGKQGRRAEQRLRLEAGRAGALLLLQACVPGREGSGVGELARRRTPTAAEQVAGAERAQACLASEAGRKGGRQAGRQCSAASPAHHSMLWWEMFGGAAHPAPQLAGCPARHTDSLQAWSSGSCEAGSPPPRPPSCRRFRCRCRRRRWRRRRRLRVVQGG